MEQKDRLAALVRSLPPAQRAGIAVALAVLVMAAVPFVQWVMTPSYTLLFAGLDDRELAEVTSELDAQGIDHRLEGTRVLVPQDQLHSARANLAEAGVSGAPAVEGYELLDEQALGVSDFRQQVDLQRAVEGELARTLGAMDAVDSATVQLVLPDEALFTEQREPASASVMVRPRTQLDQGQVESITLLVSSAVEGLDPDGVTVADTSGTTLHSPEQGTVGGVTDVQQRRTREFESALSSDLSDLLQRATDAPASVVVRASLDFDETETQTELYEDGGVPLREQTSAERYEGTGPAVGGIVGVDGGPAEDAVGAEGDYEREDATREFGVGRTTTRTVEAPGTVERLNVALVVDEGAPIGDGEIEQLVAAAAGVDAERGDQIAVSRVATPEPEEALAAEEDSAGLIEQIQRIVAMVVFLVIAIGLFLMSRRRRKEPEPQQKLVPAQVRDPQPVSEPEQPEQIEHEPDVRDEVAELVEKQPEEIAMLLRGWLADRRGA